VGDLVIAVIGDLHPVVTSGPVALRALVLSHQITKHKVPHPYSRADENARSLTGIRDDDQFGSPNCTFAFRGLL